MKEGKSAMYALIKAKAIYKQDVFDNTAKVFADFKLALEECVEGICEHCGKKDARVEFYYKDRGEFQVEIKIASDILVFFMHTNVFQFDSSSSLWQTSYVQEDSRRAYVGIINIYNFLADSYKYNRTQDMGYLIGRVFVNLENHYLVQGKQQLGYKFKDFMNGVLDKKHIMEIIESAITYTIDFDLYAPPYNAFQEVTLEQIQSLSNDFGVATGKRLGFQFSSGEDKIE